MVLALTSRRGSHNKLPKANQAVEKVRHFLSTFSDFIALGLLSMVIYVVMEVSHDSRLKLINEPQINDFYFVDYHLLNSDSDRQFRYLPLKVAFVGEQCIHFFAAKNGHNEPVGINTHVKLDAAMRPGFFHKHTISFSKSQVKNWTQQGILYDIGRPSSYYINGWIVIGPADFIRVDDAKRKKYVEPDNC